MTKNENFIAIANYFAEVGIQVPIEIMNGIEDACDENDNITAVDCYFKEDLDSFITDITFNNNIKIDVSGKSVGSNTDVFSYYGDPEYVCNERIELCNGEDVITTITDNVSEEKTAIDIEDYVVLVIEKQTWDTPEHTIDTRLLIYCPEQSPVTE